MPYYVYILARRITQHREGTGAIFTRHYGTRSLVYAEAHPDVPDAIAREKRIKRWRREWKLALIEEGNPDWRDLFEVINT